MAKADPATDFFLVWNPTTGYTKFRHPSLSAAIKESQRLAAANPGSEFFVLRPTAHSTIPARPVQTTVFDSESFGAALLVDIDRENAAIGWIGAAARAAGPSHY